MTEVLLLVVSLALVAGVRGVRGCGVLVRHRRPLDGGTRGRRGRPRRPRRPGRAAEPLNAALRRPAGHHADEPAHRLHGRAGDRAPHRRPAGGPRRPVERRVRRRRRHRAHRRDRVHDGARRAGAEEPRDRAAAADGEARPGVHAGVHAALPTGDRAVQRLRERRAAPARHRAAGGARVRALAGGAHVARGPLRAAGHAGAGHRHAAAALHRLRRPPRRRRHDPAYADGRRCVPPTRSSR